MPATVLGDQISNDNLATILTAILEMIYFLQRENMNIHSRWVGGWQYSAKTEGEIKYLGKFRKISTIFISIMASLPYIFF